MLPGSRDYTVYRAFDTPLHSQILLPELPECMQSETGVTIRCAVPGQVNPALFSSCHEWRVGDRVYCRVARRDADHLLSFPGADFLIRAGVITCIPGPGVEQGLLRHLLLNQVLPRYLAEAGCFLLHASAVTLPDGTTVAFVGESGSGKSTLAYFCRGQGAQLIDDDAVLLREGNEGTTIVGGAPTVRLHHDSLCALADNAATFVPSAGDPTKYELRLSSERTMGEGPPRLGLICLLGKAGGETTAEAVSMEPANGRSVAMAIVRSAFNLDPSDRDTMARTFRHVGALLDGEIPVYHLRYPGAYEALPQVWQALLAGSRR